MMDKYVKANQDLWNAWTPHHVTSAFYDVDGFKAGDPRRRRVGLDDLEIALIGDVRGATLLHLQCHFGLDTIAWAKRGAVVTGIDFSQEAIHAARTLASEMRVPATFVHSDVYELPQRLDGRFDIVFTSHGVLGWLPDLEAWARVVAHFVTPGGRFDLIDAHPFALLFDDRRDDGELRLLYPYFNGSQPIVEEMDGSYAAPGAPLHSVQHIWLHTMADIIAALLRAGLRLTALAEYPFVGWKMFPWMEQRTDGCWQLPGGRCDLPLMFSLAAVKDG